MYWKLQFPFHARNFAIDGKMKYIHITCVIAIILLSSVPVISIILVDWRQRQNGENVMGTLGFGITRFQPITCTAMNRNSLYYSLVLPINLMVPVGVTLLILILWIIHKVHVNNCIYLHTHTLEPSPTELQDEQGNG